MLVTSTVPTETMIQLVDICKHLPLWCGDDEGLTRHKHTHKLTPMQHKYKATVWSERGRKKRRGEKDSSPGGET